MTLAYDTLILAYVLIPENWFHEPTALGSQIPEWSGEVWMWTHFTVAHYLTDAYITHLDLWTLIAHHAGFHCDVASLSTAQYLYPTRIQGCGTQFGFCD